MYECKKNWMHFFRILRIKWHFSDQDDERSSLEKKFYLKSEWMPPKACGELERFISQVQQNFDKWRPPKWIKDNLTAEERIFLKDMKKNKDKLGLSCAKLRSSLTSSK